MIYNINIKLTTAFIGSRKPSDENLRLIARVNEKNPKLFTKRFRELCYKYATEELAMWDYNYDSIKPNGMLVVDPETDKTTIQVRKFKVPGSEEQQTESFEAYPIGTKMSFSVYIPKEANITENQLKMIITYIGQYDGISQFGINWGYGKFELESITPVLNDVETLNPSESTRIIIDEIDGGNAMPAQTNK